MMPTMFGCTLRRALCGICLVGLLTTLGQAQGTNQFVFHNSGTSALPSNLQATPNFQLSTNNALFDFENVSLPASPTMFIQRGAAQHGVFILDNNPGDTAELHHALNIELYNITNLNPNGNRAGIRVHVDPNNTVPQQSGFTFSNLSGIEIGNHGPHTTGLFIETQGAATNNGNFATQGVGIASISWGLGSLLSTEGDTAHNTLPTIGLQFNHFTQGTILSLNQASSTMSGDFIYGNAAYNGTGVLNGRFLNFNVTGIPKFVVDAGGNVQTAGKVTVPAIKANSGTRFVCVDINGTLLSQTTPCSGT